MREEHVDGGYLVTQGVYVGPEDFNKAIVRQFMVRPVVYDTSPQLTQNRSKGDWPHFGGGSMISQSLGLSTS